MDADIQIMVAGIVQMDCLVCESVTVSFLTHGILRGVKAWVHFSHARTEIAYARHMWFCSFRNNHMTSNTSVDRVFAYFCVVSPLQRMVKLY